MTDESARSIAAEPIESQQERGRLEEKMRKLEEGHRAFRSAMGVSVR